MKHIGLISRKPALASDYQSVSDAISMIFRLLDLMNAMIASLRPIVQEAKGKTTLV